ncbi:MAG TPA: glycoside hydrolase family 2 TIM barrel-domain containing protein [Roseiflexaceae bacterium]|nr:glycoside hydrolase family 2 TIM barrel-domain containing protein [Roseiflexaceae bacterium]
MAYPAVTPLNGTWRLLPTDTFRQGFYPLEDDAWLEQELPAHWQQHPLLERYTGRVVYRKRFALPNAERQTLNAEGSAEAAPPAPAATSPNMQAATDSAFIRHPPSSRYWLRLNGVFYWSQPYFNGVDLGRHEGYFVPQEHEVTAWVAAENELVVEVECPEERDKTGKRMITGVFSHWDCMDPQANPGGIWLPVELIATGPVRLKEVLLHTHAAGAEVAELRFRATLDAAGPQDVTLRWTFAPQNFAGAVQSFEQRRALAPGQTEIAGVLQLRDPQLWWPHDMGHPNMYRVTLEVLAGGEVSDAQTFGFGVRTFELHDWVAYVNGVRLFVKGCNYPPTDVRIATATRARCDEDMRLACECHMNLLRVHGHVGPPALLDAADAAGLLVWQDFPLHWLYKREVLPEAERQVRAMVRLLYNHPSVVIWCMHNEPIYVTDTKDERLVQRLRSYASVFVFSWNRDVLDTRLVRLVEREDPSRVAVRSSGEYAVPFLRPGTAGHFYYGWYKIYGQLRTWERLARRFPDNIRWVNEFGAQSFPNVESCLKFMPADVRQIDYRRLTERHMFQPNIMDYWLDWRGAETLEELVRLTQDYQIHINRFYIDRLRFYKYRPTGGIVPFMFHDPNPGVSWSVLDYWRVPKRSYHALRLAFSPQYIFTLLAKDQYQVGAPIDLPIYAVNDAHSDAPAATAARLLDPSGAELARVERVLSLPADCMALEIERLRLTPERSGTYRLALTLRPTHGEEVVNNYDIVVR